MTGNNEELVSVQQQLNFGGDVENESLWAEIIRLREQYAKALAEIEHLTQIINSSKKTNYSSEEQLVVMQGSGLVVVTKQSSIEEKVACFRHYFKGREDVYATRGFDKQGWQEDTADFLETCRQLHIPASLERSRSGNGGHVWIFFDEPIPARTARMLGSAMLILTLEKRHQIGLDSYDRLFPNQDTLPKEKKLGNLIALPLQRLPGEEETVYLLTKHINTTRISGYFSPQ